MLASSHPRRRFAEARRLLAWGFSRYRWFDAAKKKSFPIPHTVRIMKGRKAEIRLRKKGGFRALVRRGREKKITATAEIPAAVSAPVKAGQPIGRIVYELAGKKLGEIPLVAGESVERLGFFQTMIRLK